MSDSATTHWDTVYTTKAIDSVGWFQRSPDTSLRLVTAYGQPSSSVIDVGAGASSLADELLNLGWSDVTVLDVSSEALAIVSARLEGHGGPVSFVVANLLSWQPQRRYDLWHDRAVFHFLVDDADRQRYIDTSARAVKPGGVLVLGTFADDGPTQCSGLPTRRYDADGLADQFGTAFDLVASERQEHQTPGGFVQPFTWVVLRRR